MYSACTLLKVFGYYDLSVLSMSVMGFQKKVCMGGWVGGVSSPIIFGFFLTLQMCSEFTLFQSLIAAVIGLWGVYSLQLVPQHRPCVMKVDHHSSDNVLSQDVSDGSIFEGLLLHYRHHL